MLLLGEVVNVLEILVNCYLGKGPISDPSEGLISDTLSNYTYKF